MNAGMPGTGIGGLFYLASALFMPVHRLLFGGGHDGRSWRRVFAQTFIACGILLMAYATLQGLEWLAALLPPDAISGSRAKGPAIASSSAPVLLRWFAMLGAAGALLAVLAAVELARFLLRRTHAQLPLPAPAEFPPRRPARGPGPRLLPVLSRLRRRRDTDRVWETS